MLIGWFRWREAGHYLRNNVVAYAWFPLLGGLFFHLTTSVAHVDSSDLNYYLLVFAAFLVALVLNFVMVVGYQCWLDRSSLGAQGSRGRCAGPPFGAVLGAADDGGRVPRGAAGRQPVSRCSGWCW